MVEITGNGRGGEGELLRYLNRRGVGRACSLTLTTWPRPGDAMRLAPVMERVRVLYVHAPEMPLPQLLQRAAEENNVEVRFVTPQSVY
jgi:hypothetical protein